MESVVILYTAVRQSDDEKLDRLRAVLAVLRWIPCGELRLLQVDEIGRVLVFVDEGVDGKLYVLFTYAIHDEMSFLLPNIGSCGQPSFSVFSMSFTFSSLFFPSL